MKNCRRILTVCILMLLVLSVLPSRAEAASASCPEPSGEGVSVMSFNVLNNSDRDADGNWKYDPPADREKGIVQMLNAYKPDIIGIQEAGFGGAEGRLDWFYALNNDLKGTYACRSLTDDTGLKLDICRGLIIFYNKSRFTRISSGGEGYSDPVSNKRAFQWVKLRDKQNGAEFFVFNTHWHIASTQTLAENEAVRASEMQELADKVKELAGSQHFFITGDFNSAYTLANSTTKCDGTNIGAFVSNDGFKDGLIEAAEKYAVSASGKMTALQATDRAVQTCLDHVIYHADYYTADKMQKIQVRTYPVRMSDHDAVLVNFTYKMPSFSVTASERELSAYYTNGTYYIDQLNKRTTDLPLAVELNKGAIYADPDCTEAAGEKLTLKSGDGKTYRDENTLYIKFGGSVHKLILRSCNVGTASNTMYVDKSLIGKEAGSTGLYCDQWGCRAVTVGVNGFSTIQQAVDAAESGETIMVAPGTYTEEIRVSGKSLYFYGSNRINVKALVMKDGQLSVNPDRSHETYISGNITFDQGALQSSALMINGFCFIGRAANAQIMLTGGDADSSIDLRICNNLFNCYTDKSTVNGSAILGVTAIEKWGVIEDNYFHLTNSPSYTDSDGATVYYTNRGITLRNLRGLTINANYFDGYYGSKKIPFWLSSEVTDGHTTPGYGNLAFTANRIENCGAGSILINNVRDMSIANLLIGGNSYGGTKVTVDFRETANQLSQNLPTDKSKISFHIQTDDELSVNILPETDSGVTAKQFDYYVTFRNEASNRIYAHSVVSGTSAAYNGPTPVKNATLTSHYTFRNWVDAGGVPIDLGNIGANTDAYATFTQTQHTVVIREHVIPTCTASGYTGDRCCEVCDLFIAGGKPIEPNGHTIVIDAAIKADCVTPGLTEGGYCSACGEVFSKQEYVAPFGHAEVIDAATAPTCSESGRSEGKHCITCGAVYEAQRLIPARGHTAVIDAAVKPDCINTGLAEGAHCAVCGQILAAQEVIPATGHSYLRTDNGEKHIACCTRCSYNADEEHLFAEGRCACGAFEGNESILDTNLKLDMDISVGAEMVVKYSFPADVVGDYADFFLEVRKNAAGSELEITTYGIGDEHVALDSITDPVTGAALICNASYDGIAAKEMGDNFAATLYAIDANGKVYKGETVVSSIRDFLIGKLNDASAISEMKAMAVDMLKYGAAAQLRFGYDTENLVTDSLTQAQLAYATQKIPEATDRSSLSGDGANVATSVTVGPKVELKLSCIAAGLSDARDVRCIITAENGVAPIESETANVEKIMFLATYGNVGARDMRKLISATFFDGDRLISKTVKWSVESYVAQVRADPNSTPEEISMVNAMLNYGDSVANYLTAIDQ